MIVALTHEYLNSVVFQSTTLKSEFPSDPNSKILLLLLDKGHAKKTDLLSITTMHTVERALSELLKGDLITIKEEFIGRRTYEISLTPKGRAVAEQLKRAEEIAQKGYYVDTEKGVVSISEKAMEDWAVKFKEMTKGMSLLYHVNVFEDHVTIAEEKDGMTRITNVYVRVNGNGIMRLWCELDESFDCGHVEYAWTLPSVQEMYANNLKNGRVKK